MVKPKQLAILTRGENRSGQAYEKIYKSESGHWTIIGHFSWPGLSYLKVWPSLKAYFQIYFILRSSNSSFDLLNRLNKP